MSDMQNIIAALIAAIKEKRITVDVAEAAVRMLDGVPDYCHMDAIKALLKAPEPEEQPEDYLAVKTFNSVEFHVGDEVTDGTAKGVVISTSETSTRVIDARGGIVGFGAFSAWHRTGRNFPAIPAILDELKKA